MRCVTKVSVSKRDETRGFYLSLRMFFVDDSLGYLNVLFSVTNSNITLLKSITMFCGTNKIP